MKKAKSLGNNLWYSPEVRGYLMLEVTDSVPQLPVLEFEGQSLAPKEEFHSTLMVVHDILEKSPQSDAELERHIVEEATLMGSAIQFKGFTGDFFLCRKGEESTIIGIIELQGSDELQTRVSTLAGFMLEPAVPHVTLYKSANSQYGIGINSPADFAAYATPLEPLLTEKLKDILL